MSPGNETVHCPYSSTSRVRAIFVSFHFRLFNFDSDRHNQNSTLYLTSIVQASYQQQWNVIASPLIRCLSGFWSFRCGNDFELDRYFWSTRGSHNLSCCLWYSICCFRILTLLCCIHSMIKTVSMLRLETVLVVERKQLLV